MVQIHLGVQKKFDIMANAKKFFIRIAKKRERNISLKDIEFGIEEYDSRYDEIWFDGEIL